MNNYQKGKENARQNAINWQLAQSVNNYSLHALYIKQVELTKLAKRYGLIKEFRENGLI